MDVEEGLKVRLMGEMEAEVEKLLKEAGDRRTVTLRELEQVVGEAGRRMQQRLMERLVAEAMEAQGREGGDCPACGGKLSYKGQKERWVATINGEVRVKRGYFYCEACGEGIFPPGSEVGAE